MWKNRDDLRDVDQAVRNSEEKSRIMLFDTDVLIWTAPRQSERPQRLSMPAMIVACIGRHVYGIAPLEPAKTAARSRASKGFLAELAFAMVPLSENIGHCALIYMEEYGLKVSMCMADALLAATAVELQCTLCTANRKHYSPIGELDLRVLRP